VSVSPLTTFPLSRVAYAISVVTDISQFLQVTLSSDTELYLPVTSASWRHWPTFPLPAAPPPPDTVLAELNLRQPLLQPLEYFHSLHPCRVTTISPLQSAQTKPEATSTRKTFSHWLYFYRSAANEPILTKSIYSTSQVRLLACHGRFGTPHSALRRHQSLNYSINSQHSVQSQGPKFCSQKPTIDAYPEPVESSPYHSNTYFPMILILSPHLWNSLY
jgi:hypothetical protein